MLRLRHPTQLSLPLRAPAPESPARRATPPQVNALREELRQRLAAPVRIDVHDNRSIMVSYRRDAQGYAIRLHRMFIPPSPELAERLTRFVVGRGRAEAGRWLDRYIRDHQGDIRKAPSPPVPSSRGRTRDLQPIFDALNRRFFGDAIDAQIGWSRAPSGRRRRTIKMGVYLHDHRHIRIHPALDRPEIPDYFVEFVVYHEMCHQICPPEPGPGGHKRIHTRAFREREKLHPERERALTWEKKNLHLLLHAPLPKPAGGGRRREDYP